MDKERSLLNPKKLGEIYGVLSPILTLQQKRQFIGLARSLGACWKQSYGLKKNIDELVIPASQGLQYAEHLWADIAQRSLGLRNLFIIPKTPSLEAVWAL